MVGLACGVVGSREPPYFEASALSKAPHFPPPGVRGFSFRADNNHSMVLLYKTSMSEAPLMPARGFTFCGDEAVVARPKPADGLTIL